MEDPVAQTQSFLLKTFKVTLPFSGSLLHFHYVDFPDGHREWVADDLFLILYNGPARVEELPLEQKTHTRVHIPREDGQSYELHQYITLRQHTVYNLLIDSLARQIEGAQEVLKIICLGRFNAVPPYELKDFWLVQQPCTSITVNNWLKPAPTIKVHDNYRDMFHPDSPSLLMCRVSLLHFDTTEKRIVPADHLLEGVLTAEVELTGEARFSSLKIRETSTHQATDPLQQQHQQQQQQGASPIDHGFFCLEFRLETQPKGEDGMAVAGLSFGEERVRSLDIRVNRNLAPPKRKRSETSSGSSEQLSMHTSPKRPKDEPESNSAWPALSATLAGAKARSQAAATSPAIMQQQFGQLPTMQQQQQQQHQQATWDISHHHHQQSDTTSQYLNESGPVVAAENGGMTVDYSGLSAEEADAKLRSDQLTPQQRQMLTSQLVSQLQKQYLHAASGQRRSLAMPQGASTPSASSPSSSSAPLTSSASSSSSTSSSAASPPLNSSSSSSSSPPSSSSVPPSMAGPLHQSPSPAHPSQAGGPPLPGGQMQHVQQPGSPPSVIKQSSAFARQKFSSPMGMQGEKPMDGEGGIPSSQDQSGRIDITHLLMLPQSVAASRLNMSNATFSKRFRQANDNKRWPYRGLQVIDKQLKDAQAKNQKATIQALEEKKKALLAPAYIVVKK